MVDTQVQEIIGHTQDTQLWRFSAARTVDKTITDYQFWDEFRRGLQPGYEFGSLFSSPMAQIVASYVLGDGVEFILAESVEASQANIDHTNELLKVFSEYLNNLMYSTVEDLYSLADMFLVLNPDGSISIPSPNMVQADYMEDDYRTLEKVTITTITKKGKIEDVYTIQGRSVITYQGGKIVNQEDFPNLIGRIPIVHFANDRGINETHGRVIYESLLPLFQAYDDLTVKGVTGAEALGNPIPVLSGLKGVNSVQQANAPVEDETYTDQDGNTEDRNTINLDKNSMLLLGEGARADMLAPPVGFTNDTRAMLKALFLLILDHSRIPEALWGGAIASSKASAEVQMPPFHIYIKRRQNMLAGLPNLSDFGVEARGGLYEVADIWLAYRALADRRVVLGATSLQFDRLGDMDPEIKRKWSEMLFKSGAISTTMMNRLSNLIDDPKGALAEAKKENEESPDFDDFPERVRQAMANQPDEDEEVEVAA